MFADVFLSTFVQCHYVFGRCRIFNVEINDDRQLHFQYNDEGRTGKSWGTLLRGKIISIGVLLAYLAGISRLNRQSPISWSRLTAKSRQFSYFSSLSFLLLSRSVRNNRKWILCDPMAKIISATFDNSDSFLHFLCDCAIRVSRLSFRVSSKILLVG